ncbi:MAG: hypothetical protein Q9220_000924 [cf. Caloplaca sp. 1 TL-2023]
MRYFTPWVRPHPQKLLLPNILRILAGQRDVPIGECVVQTNDFKIGNEMCEELFTPDAPSIHLGLSGVEVICNSSASHWQLRKLNRRLELMQESSKKGGSLYLYANQIGCEGEARLYWDGCALIILNGEILAQGSQFSLNEVEVISATADLDQLWGDAHSQPARRMQAAKEPEYQQIELDSSFADDGFSSSTKLTPTKTATVLGPEAEIGNATGAWMWDYIRRSGQAGAFIPLSGGLDSAAASVMFASTVRMVYKETLKGNQQVIDDMRRICGEPNGSTWLPTSPEELCNRTLHTCYMGTENSSKETRDRARRLAHAIGSYHIDLNFDGVIKAVTTLFFGLFGFQLRYKIQEYGSEQSGLALQNLQARLRMVLAYLLSSTLTIVRGRPGGGYLTKYDASSGDICPTASISKTDLARFLDYARTEYSLPGLKEFLSATPTAELEPITESYTQTDEDDMGCTYNELSTWGRLRKIEKLGPYSMFQRLRAGEWSQLTPRVVYERIRFLWTQFGLSRHKQEIMTPALFAETYSPDSNRFDLLPFLRPRLIWQYNKIEESIKALDIETSKSNAAIKE